MYEFVQIYMPLPPSCCQMRPCFQPVHLENVGASEALSAWLAADFLLVTVLRYCLFIIIIIIIRKYYYGGAVALLLQDHLTMSL